MALMHPGKELAPRPLPLPIKNLFPHASAYCTCVARVVTPQYGWF